MKQHTPAPTTVNSIDTYVANFISADCYFWYILECETNSRGVNHVIYSEKGAWY